MSTINETIAAGAVGRYFVSGHFMRLQAGDDLTVTFYRKGEMIGKYERAMSGFAAKVPQGFDRFDLQNTGVIPAAVRVFLGEESGIDIQFAGLTGTVSVINGELSRVSSGAAFSGQIGQPGVAGQYSLCQLWNPAANTKNIILTKASFYSLGGAAEYLVGKLAAAATSLVGVGLSKKLGGAVGTGERRTSTNAAFQIATADRMLVASTDAAKKMIDVPFSEPVLIPPGFGLGIECATVALHTQATFQWFEESV